MAPPKYGELLTPLEVWTLHRLAQGMHNQMIARQDGCQRSAVANRLWRCKVKLGAQTSIQTVMMAHKLGFFEVDPPVVGEVYSSYEQNDRPTQQPGTCVALATESQAGT